LAFANNRAVAVVLTRREVVLDCDARLFSVPRANPASLAMIVGAVAVAEYPKPIANTKTMGASNAIRQPDQVEVEEGRRPFRNLRVVEVDFLASRLSEGRIIGSSPL